MIFVDANILIDLVAVRSPFYEWSNARFRDLTRTRPGTINAIVLAEFAPRFLDLTQFRAVVAGFDLTVRPIDDASSFRAGTAFQDYRDRGGPRATLIPDFLIGAHAATLGIPLLTRDGARFASYFPELALITPETTP